MIRLSAVVAALAAELVGGPVLKALRDLWRELVGEWERTGRKNVIDLERFAREAPDEVRTQTEAIAKRARQEIERRGQAWAAEHLPQAIRNFCPQLDEQQLQPTETETPRFDPDDVDRQRELAAAAGAAAARSSQATAEIEAKSD